MHPKTRHFLVPVFAWVAVTTTVVAAGPQKDVEQTAWPRFGHEFRSGLTFDNRGFAPVEPGESKPPPTTTMSIERAKLKLTGDLSPDVSFFVRLAFEPTAKQTLDYAMLTLRLDDTWSVGSGRTWNYISGYEWPYSLAEYVGTGAFPFTMGATTVLSGYSKQTFELSRRGYVNVRLQLLDDVRIVSDKNGKRASGGYFSTGTQPAATLQLQTESIAGTAWKPMIQMATYDAGHSRIYTLGGLYKEGPWLAYVQTAIDYQAQISTSGEKKTDARRYASGLVEYASGEWTPFMRWQWFDIKQGNADSNGNSHDIEDVTLIDDNITSLSAGARFLRYGERFMPYAAIAASSARFLDKSGDNSSTRTLSQVKIGVISKL